MDKMITKFEKYNESLRDLMVGPTKEEVFDYYRKYYMKDRLTGLINSIPESPEDFFLQMKEGCIEMGTWKNFSTFGKNHKEIFWIDTRNNDESLYVSCRYIWQILENVYGLNYIEIQSLIKGLLLDDENWSGLTSEECDL